MKVRHNYVSANNRGGETAIYDNRILFGDVSRNVLGLARQVDGNRGAGADVTFNIQVPAVQLRQFFRQGKPQSGSFLFIHTLPFDLNERLQD